MASDYFWDDNNATVACPRCALGDIIIFEDGSCCCSRCKYPIDLAAEYSKGFPFLSLPDSQAYHNLNNPPWEIEAKGEPVTDWYPRANNVTDLKDFANKRRLRKLNLELKWGNFNHLPSDYNACDQCNYDHAYDYTPAKLWHDSHPECGEMLTQDDLVPE